MKAADDEGFGGLLHTPKRQQQSAGRSDREREREGKSNKERNKLKQLLRLYQSIRSRRTRKMRTMEKKAHCRAVIRLKMRRKQCSRRKPK